MLKALADRTRRQISVILAEDLGITVQDLVAHFPVSRVAIMKHLNILEAAWLLRREREGPSKRLFLEPEPLHEVPDWLKELGKAADVDLLPTPWREAAAAPPG